jgi:hypothetical protein
LGKTTGFFTSLNFNHSPYHGAHSKTPGTSSFNGRGFAGKTDI